MSPESLMREIRKYEAYLNNRDVYIRATAQQKIDELWDELEVWIALEEERKWNELERRSESLHERTTELPPKEGED